MDVLAAIRARRSVRKFQPTPVPDEVLADVLDAGRLAPTSGNGQNFFFGVVRDDATKQALAQAAGGQEWVATAPVVIAYCARLGPDLATLPEEHPARVVNVARFSADLVSYLNAYPDRDRMRVLLENGTPLLPGEQMFLAAVGHGLRACWIGHLDTREAGRLLDLPDGMVCLFLMPMGYPDEEPGPRKLREVQECVFYDRWPADRTA